MVIIGRTAVVALGVPGPLLGDGANTICVILVPSLTSAPGQLPVAGVGGLTIVTDTPHTGTRISAINHAATTQIPRVRYPVSRVQFGGAHGNTGLVYFGGPGTLSTNSVPLIPDTWFPPLGLGHVPDLDLGDFDINADVNGEVVMWIAEIQ